MIVAAARDSCLIVISSAVDLNIERDGMETASVFPASINLPCSVGVPVGKVWDVHVQAGSFCADIAPSYISTEHAALLMDVSQWTVRRWISCGRLSARKMPSGCIRIAVFDLETLGEPVYPVPGRLPSRSKE